MTSAASRQRRSSGSEPKGRGVASFLLFTGLFTAWILLAPPAAAAEHVVTEGPDGTIDWTERVVRVTGVGTPKILSPTGAVTAEDLHAKAREDAAARVARALRDVPVGGGVTIGQIAALDAAREAAARGFRSGEALDFSDGTVHLPAEAGFDWIATAWPGEAGAPAGGEGTVTGLIIELSGEPRPAARLELRGPDGASASAGARGDRFGSAGIVWARARVDAPEGFVGASPRVVAGAMAGDGVIALGADAAALFTGDALPGGLLVIVPAAASEAAKKPGSRAKAPVKRDRRREGKK